MTDREKVIKGLECCNGYCDDETGCPYFDELEPFDCQEQLRADAITLLKAREPKLVTNIHKEHNNVLNPNVPWIGKCPKCGKKIEGRNLTRFCKFCGQAVKWE